MERAFQIEKDKTIIDYEEFVSITIQCASQHLGNESEDYSKAVTDSDFTKIIVTSSVERGLGGWGRKKRKKNKQKKE